MELRDNPPDLIDRAEVAALLGVAEWTVRQLTASGGLPCIKHGRRVLYHRAEVEAWRARGRNEKPNALPLDDFLAAVLRGGEVTFEVTVRIKPKR